MLGKAVLGHSGSILDSLWGRPPPGILDLTLPEVVFSAFLQSLQRAAEKSTVSEAERTRKQAGQAGGAVGRTDTREKVKFERTSALP